MKDINSARTITVRITSEEEKGVLKKIVTETGCKQISKALMKTAEGYVRLCELSRHQIDEINRLRKENEMYRNYAEIIVNTGKAMQTFKKNKQENIVDKANKTESSYSVGT